MGLFQIIAVLLTLAALAGYVNERFLRLPTVVGVMVVALAFSGLVILLQRVGEVTVLADMDRLIRAVDFDQTLLHGLLSFLLFAGALQVNFADLTRQGWPVAALASLGVLISTAVIGFLGHWALGLAGIDLPLIHCLLLGAIISPTDPIAVLAILKQAHAPREMEVLVAGESLLNDGVAVVVFLVLLALAQTDAVAPEPLAVAGLFVREAVGGALLGLGAGLAAFWLLRSIDAYQVEILVTLALVTGGYALADALHVSGPIAMVAAGLLIGNHGRLFAMSAATREHLDEFWTLVDELLNAVLFLLIGLELLAVALDLPLILASAVMIPVVLLARLTSVLLVGLPFRLSPATQRLLVWGGLRGGISVALALSLPGGPERDVIVTVTYLVVTFSVIVQGLTVRRLIP